MKTAHIKMYFRVLFPSTTWDWDQPITKVFEQRYVATKDVELHAAPKPGDYIEDGLLNMRLFSVKESLQGPGFICEADYGYSYGWNDMGGVPGYYGLPMDSLWFTLCPRQGWEMRNESRGFYKPQGPYFDYLRAESIP